MGTTELVVHITDLDDPNNDQENNMPSDAWVYSCMYASTAHVLYGSLRFDMILPTSKIMKKNNENT